MGILNITPDSFSDGGMFLSPDAALHHAHHMIQAGADLIDIGAESTRPGAKPITLQTELDRLMPVVEKLVARYDTALSIDTSKPEVMKAAVLAGATCINDVFALQKEHAIETVASLNVPVCLMHMRGTPETMQNGLNPNADIFLQVQDFFERRVQACLNGGIAATRIILDPGFGFGKSVQQNLTITKRIADFSLDRFHLMLGVSRKSTIGLVLNQSKDQRLSGGLALSVFAALQGAAIIRTHDVSETRQALSMIDVMLQQKEME